MGSTLDDLCPRWKMMILCALWPSQEAERTMVLCWKSLINKQLGQHGGICEGHDAIQISKE